MSDIYCAKCGEPWDSYGVHASKHNEGDMKPSEAERFLKGEGCPCCHFGTVCVDCHGTGIEDCGYRAAPDCAECSDNHKLLVRDPQWRQFTGYEYGYQPKVRYLPPELKVKILSPREVHQCREGRYNEFFILCPHCCSPEKVQSQPKCQTCDGDGKFKSKNKDEAWLRHAASSIEGTDDPDTIMQGLGLL